MSCYALLTSFPAVALQQAHPSTAACSLHLPQVATCQWRQVAGGQHLGVQSVLHSTPCHHIQKGENVFTRQGLRMPHLMHGQHNIVQLLIPPASLRVICTQVRWDICWAVPLCHDIDQ